MNKLFVLMGKISIIITIVFCISISGALAQDFREFPPGLHWKQIETDHFKILFDEPYRDIGQKVAAMAEPICEDVTGLLHYTPASKTYVILTDHVDYANGYANPIPTNKIVLFLHEPGAGSEFFGFHSYDWLSYVLTHEYTHIVQIDMAQKWNAAFRKIFGRVVLPNASLPMWMIEGTAVYTETKFHGGRGHHPYYDMMMRTEVMENRLKTLDQMAAIGLRVWPMRTICYLYGYFFLQYLADTYGEESIVQLSLKNSGKFPVLGGNIFKKVYRGKHENKLWREWRDALQAHYASQIAQIQSAPVTELQSLSHSGYYTNSPVFSPDGEYVYYIEIGPHNTPTFIQLRLRDGVSQRLTAGDSSGNFSLSADGQTLYFCKTDTYHTFSDLSDLYKFDVQHRKVYRLTKGLRAFDPAVSPDGKSLVFTTVQAGNTNRLMRLNLETKTITPILETSEHIQIRHPAFSADGSKLALQIWKEGGFQDIYVMHSDGSGLTALTYDLATDASPVWGPHDECIFFSSDRTGVPNIFAYSLQDKRLYQVTNVLTGVFNPDIAPDGSQLVFEHYSGKGMDIHRAAFARETWKETPYTFAQQPEPNKYVAKTIAPLQEHGYNPIPSLLPKLWMPTWGIDEEGWQLGMMTFGQDVLGQHSYDLSVLYGLESNRIGLSGIYTNSQFFPTFTLFGSDSANVFSDIFKNEQAQKKSYWQREQVAGLHVSIPIYQSHKTGLFLTTGYRYKKMKPLTDPDMLTPTPDEGVLSGISAGISFQRLDSSIYAISPESGLLTSVTYRRDDKDIGSDFDLHTVVGDARVYLKIPGLRHHVLALRTTGGWSDGDTLTQGVFRLGGSDINSDLAALEQQRFFLRGYKPNALSGDRFALGSVEYRFPIWYPQRGIGATLFFDSLVGAIFYDIGNAWNAETKLSDFKSSVGGELRINTIIQSSLPITFRLGYAQGLDDDLGKSQFIYTFAFNFAL